LSEQIFRFIGDRRLDKRPLSGGGGDVELWKELVVFLFVCLFLLRLGHDAVNETISFYGRLDGRSRRRRKKKTMASAGICVNVGRQFGNRIHLLSS